jgi:hypothetical protein
MARAQAARYAASKPFIQARAAATGGATGATIAVTSAIPRRGATTGAASAFAGIEYSGTTPNCMSRIGAVATPHAPETATTSARERGTGYPANDCCRRGTTTKIAATAANESWKPASSSEYGLQASRSAAPRSRKYQRSLGREASHASEASAPATPARTTEGCHPTAST